MNVEIEAGGRRVKIDCSDTNTSYREIADKALEVWTGTDGAKEHSDGPASFGVTLERKGFQVSPMSLGGYGREYVEEPKANG